MTHADIQRIFEEQAQAEANEQAEAKRLSKARLMLRKRLEEVEHGDEDADS